MRQIDRLLEAGFEEFKGDDGYRYWRTMGTPDQHQVLLSVMEDHARMCGDHPVNIQSHDGHTIVSLHYTSAQLVDIAKALRAMYHQIMQIQGRLVTQMTMLDDSTPMPVDLSKAYKLCDAGSPPMWDASKHLANLADVNEFTFRQREQQVA